MQNSFLKFRQILKLYGQMKLIRLLQNRGPHNRIELEKNVIYFE